MLLEETFLQNAARSPWILLAGISITRIFPDLLHILDLSLAPDAAASDAWLPWLPWHLRLHVQFLGLGVLRFTKFGR